MEGRSFCLYVSSEVIRYKKKEAIMIMLSVPTTVQVVLFSVFLIVAGILWVLYKNKKRKKDTEQLPEL
jgi:hypothetical protein